MYFHDYKPGEAKVSFVAEDGNRYLKDLLVRIGKDDSTNICILNDNNVYITKENSTVIYYYEKIDGELLDLLQSRILTIKNNIGHTSQLKCGNNIVEAINILAEVRSTTNIYNVIQWVIEDEKDLDKCKPNDKDIAYLQYSNEWCYYSAATKNWYIFPDGWQNYKYIVRKREELNGLNIVGGDRVGILETGVTYIKYNGQLTTTESLDIGTYAPHRYIVQNYIRKGNITKGTLYYTEAGYKGIID